MGGAAELSRKQQAFDCRNLGWDHPHDNRYRASLLEYVDSKPNSAWNRKADISGSRLDQFLCPVDVTLDQRHGDYFSLVWSQRPQPLYFHRRQLAVDFYLRRAADLEIQVLKCFRN